MFAHALIVDPRDGKKYDRGETVPDDLPGIEELQDAGSVSDEQYEGDVVQVGDGDNFGTDEQVNQ